MVCDSYFQQAEAAVTILEQRSMFELCDCSSDGNIDFCDFLSLYSQIPNSGFEDLLLEWHTWVCKMATGFSLHLMRHHFLGQILGG